MSENSAVLSNTNARRIVLLDLDGTLTQSDAGIIACAKIALRKLQQPIPDDAEMQRFIGPSIMESFQRNHVPAELLQDGLALYRKYYSEEAVFDDPNHPGKKIPGCLLNKVYEGSATMCQLNCCRMVLLYIVSIILKRLFLTIQIIRVRKFRVVYLTKFMRVFLSSL